MTAVAMMLAVPAAAIWPFSSNAKQPAETPVAEPAGKVVMVLVDSASTADAEARQRVNRDFAALVGAMGGGDVLIGDVISENPLATSSMPLDIRFPRPAQGAGQGAQTRMTRLRREASDIVTSWTATSPTSSQKDLFGALLFASKVVNGSRHAGAPSRNLVLFSDMVHETPRLNLVTDSLTSDAVGRIIDTEREAGRLPDLSGVDVWVAGATAATRGGLDPERILLIQTFWLRFLRECGANVAPDRYASTLINFPGRD